MPLTGVMAVPVAVIVGVPALRLRGFFLALATLAFAFAAEQWLFTQSFLSNRNQITPIAHRGELVQPAYYMSLFVALAIVAGLYNLNKSRVVRAFRAIRDSETTAVAMGIDPLKYKLLAFALSGFIAGIAGGCAGYLHIKILAANFSFFGSLQFLVFTVIAGIALLAGGLVTPIIGWIGPTLLLPHSSNVNNGPTILLGFAGIRTVIDYPNGLAAFFTRVLRRFDPSERVAWASAETEGGSPASAAAAAAAEADLAQVAEAVGARTS